MDVTGKRLLVLGGTAASRGLVETAKAMGVYTIVVDDRTTGPAKEIADEAAIISTADLDALECFAREKAVDGVFCTANEFNIRNTMQLCKRLGLPFYANQEQWARCNNKQTLKEYCRKNGLPVIPEYFLEDAAQAETLPESVFPVIVKPVDGAGSRGVQVCRTQGELKAAVKAAVENSVSGKCLVEKYMDNGGKLFSFRYMLQDGNCYPYMLFDTYIVDPINKKYLISAFSYFPSEQAEQYMRTTDSNVRRMLQDMGLKNGTVFAQTLPCNGEFYCHDMGYRLSGGLLFPISQALGGINDMKMMIRYALGGPMCTPQELEQINLTPKGKVVGQLMVPLNPGTIGSICGMEELKTDPSVIQCLQIYQEGDTIAEKAMGTLGQHFARIAVIAEDKAALIRKINRIQDNLSIRNTQGEEMYTMRFDTARLDSSAF